MKCYKCKNEILNFEQCVKVHTMKGGIRLFHFSCFPKELDPVNDPGVLSRFKGINFFWAFMFCISMGTFAVWVTESYLLAVGISILCLILLILAPEPEFVFIDEEEDAW